MTAVIVTIYSRVFVVKTRFLACKRFGVPIGGGGGVSVREREREREKVQMPSSKAFMAAAQCTVD